MDVLRARLMAFFEKNVIAMEPPHQDDEANYGVLASDLARATGYNPAIIKAELDKMELAGNPLVTPDTLNCGRRAAAFRELTENIRMRIDRLYPGRSHS